KPRQRAARVAGIATRRPSVAPSPGSSSGRGESTANQSLPRAHVRTCSSPTPSSRRRERGGRSSETHRSWRRVCHRRRADCPLGALYRQRRTSVRISQPTTLFERHIAKPDQGEACCPPYSEANKSL